MTKHAHITIMVVINDDRTWSYKDPRGHKEVELTLPQSTAHAMDYNQVIQDLIARATIEFDTAYRESLDQSEGEEDD